MMLIAEVGCNHKGNLEIAKKFIEVAALHGGCDVVKFQKRCLDEFSKNPNYHKPHPFPENAYGETYAKHRMFLEFTAEQHKELIETCEKFGIAYSTSVWDLQSAREINMLEPQLIKVPSACNVDFSLLAYLCAEYKGKIHVSLGMTTREEEEKIVNFFFQQKRQNDLVLYACTSGYPVKVGELALLEIQRLKETYSDVVFGIGFSGHHTDIISDIAAKALGATFIERHFTLNKFWKGTDHSASLEPEEFKKLSSNLKHIEKALRYKEKEILDIEQPQRKKLKRL